MRLSLRTGKVLVATVTLVAGVGFVLGLGMSPAAADDIFPLGAGGTTYVNVDVSLSSGTATITYTPVGGYFLIDTSIADANLASTATLPGTGTASPSGALTNNGSQNVDGWGIFNQAFNDGSGCSPSAQNTSATLTFTTTATTAGSVLTPNGDGNVAAAHVCQQSNTANTFFVSGNGGVTPPITGVPEPGSLSLLGLGLVSLGGWFRRRQA